MSTTPSPSKRPRIPTSSAAPSATASPFPGAGVSAGRPPAPGPRSVGPTGNSAMPIFGLGMSPVDSFSPAPGTVDTYGMSGFTPYSTTSPAYGGAMASAASPISTALAHGSRVLSGIQAGSPFYNGTPMPAQQRYAPASMHPTPIQFQHPQALPSQQPAKQPTAPQHGSPEHLKLALHHLQTTLLAKLESEAEAFFDAADSATDREADTRVVASKAAGFAAAMDSTLAYLEKNGLASIPLLPLPTEQGTEEASKAAAEAIEGPITSEPTKAQPTATADDAAPKPSAPTASLHSQIEVLQHQAKQLFDRRQRLKESASIVGGILDS